MGAGLQRFLMAAENETIASNVCLSLFIAHSVRSNPLAANRNQNYLFTRGIFLPVRLFAKAFKPKLKQFLNREMFLFMSLLRLSLTHYCSAKICHVFFNVDSPDTDYSTP